MELSTSYFTIVCALTLGAVVLALSIAKPERERFRGLAIFGISLCYVTISLFLTAAWGELMNKWYGQWPSFTLGIIYGIPVLVLTTGTALSLIGLSFYIIISSKIPTWIEAASTRSVASRLGIGMAVLLVLIVIAGFVLGAVLRET